VEGRVLTVQAVNWLLPICAWLLAPLLPGIINQVKAKFAGRKGPSLFQLYYDLYKLLRKDFVYSRTTSVVFRIAPVLILVCMLFACMILPWGGFPAPISFDGDFILLLYLLGLARFATVLAALDTGSSFEGMGASREVLISALAEPALLLGFMVLILHTGSSGLLGIASGITASDWQSTAPLLVMVSFAWYFILLAENSRLPVDDPNTHLELTMIHEVMVLDSEGVDFAMIQYAAALKLWIFSGLLVNLTIPVKHDIMWLQALTFLGGMFLVSIIVGITESIMARLRLINIPKVLIGSGALSLIALIVKLVDLSQ
jgi:formate hydrogenlyase subunit 4